MSPNSMKRFSLLFLTTMIVLSAYGQAAIRGRVLDRDTKEGLPQATVQLLNAKDSTFAAGVLTDAEGNFNMKSPHNGSFIIRITSVGYKQYGKKITVTKGQDLALGDVIMGSDAIMLKGAMVSGQARKRFQPLAAQS